MHTSITVIIFISLLQATFTDKILNSSVKNEKQAAQLFAVIQPEEVLPLILFKIAMKKRPAPDRVKFVLRIPEDAIEAVTSDRKMVKGTKFFRENSDMQLFFCPKQNSEQKCLVSQNFEDSIQLHCAEEPIPLIEKEDNQDSCGEDNNGILYNTTYRICHDEEYDTKEITINTFCYDSIKRKTLHTFHEIFNPLLLKSHLLFRERNVSYPFMANDQFETSNFEGMNISSNTDLNSVTHPEKTSYGIQKMVPDTDLAFALWRKTAYQNYNFDWQHKMLIPLWDKINFYVKTEAIRMKEVNGNISIYIHTAVVNITPNPKFEDNTQIYNIWVKMVTTTTFRPSKKTNKRKSKGIAILMNNFITGKTDDSIESSNSTEEPIDEFCTDSFCVESLVNEFKNVGGQVRCCSLTKEIGKVFGISDIDADIEVFDISGINDE